MREKINEIKARYDEILLSKGYDPSLFIYCLSGLEKDSMVNIDNIKKYDMNYEINHNSLFLVYENINTGMQIADLYTADGDPNTVKAVEYDIDMLEAYDYNLYIYDYAEFIPSTLDEFLIGVNEDLLKIKLKEFIDKLD